MSNLAISVEERHEIVSKALGSLEAGCSLRSIAEQLGMAYATLRVWLLDDVPEKYKPAQRQALLTRIAEADQGLEDASSHLAIARAREIAKFARWDAERRLPSMFSQRTEITGPGGGPIQLDHFQRAQRFAFLREQVERHTIDITPAVQHEKHSLTELSTDG